MAQRSDKGVPPTNRRGTLKSGPGSDPLWGIKVAAHHILSRLFCTSIAATSNSTHPAHTQFRPLSRAGGPELLRGFRRGGAGATRAGGGLAYNLEAPRDGLPGQEVRVDVRDVPRLHRRCAGRPRMCRLVGEVPDGQEAPGAGPPARLRLQQAAREHRLQGSAKGRTRAETDRRGHGAGGLRLRGEGRPSGEGHVEEDAQRPQVHPAAVELPGEHLRRHVVQGPRHTAQGGGIRRGHQAR
mmetsp:Transcript_31876/g.90976  ORF Transcript_31876/g.90976 Transcript_31876/m.90976 type:complete len:240 (-) Transcript_31876:684-1403(-)